MASHWSGTQSGWNTRGGETTRETMARLREEAEINNPDSQYWANAANHKLQEINQALGESYDLWAEMTWPENSINEMTWKDIYETVSVSLSVSDKIWMELECTCNGVTGPCKVCQAQGRLTAKCEIGG